MTAAISKVLARLEAAEADARQAREALRSVAMVQAKWAEGHYEFDEQAWAEIANVVKRALGRA